MLNVEMEKIPLVTDSHGVVRVGGTRIPLETVIEYYDAGCAPEDIVRKFDSLKLDDVYAVLTYYLRHEGDVRAYLAKREAESEVVRREVQAKFSTVGLRDRLLRRKGAPGPC